MKFTPETLWIVLLLMVAIGMGWGILSYLSRDKSKDAASERATRKVMSEPGKDEAEEVNEPPPS